MFIAAPLGDDHRQIRRFVRSALEIEGRRVQETFELKPGLTEVVGCWC